MKFTIPKLVTGGGKITCPRCTAISKRSGEQCKKPALRIKAVCKFHGGRSTGAKTEAGKARQAAAVLKTGGYAKEAIEDRARSVRVLRRVGKRYLRFKYDSRASDWGRKSLCYICLIN